jgi:hypothetical protein
LGIGQIARFESRFACVLSNCGPAVSQPCNFNCTTDQHSKREERVRWTMRETPSDAAECVTNPVTLAKTF